MWWMAWALAQDRGARADDAAFPDEVAAPPPRDRLWYTNATFIRVNPLGLVDIHKVGWRRRLSTKPGILFADTWLFTGVTALVTPAYSRLGVFAEAQPLAVLRAFAEVTGTGYYGTFDQVLTFDDPTARYSDQTLNDRSAEARPAYGWTATFGVTLQAKVGPIAARSTPQVTRIDLALGEPGLYFYDQYWDRLAPDGGWMVLNDLDVLFVQGKMRTGLRHTFSDTLDGRRDGSDSALSHHRLGPLFAWQFSDRPPGKRFNQPTLFVVAQWWLQHPYRAGEEQPQGLPLFAAGFAFNGDHRTSAVPAVD
ncbi:MAG: hypothetical protein R3F61_02415 [Myxococcota bacterium]